jgi:capsular polysaccharide transport system permease protein
MRPFRPLQWLIGLPAASAAAAVAAPGGFERRAETRLVDHLFIFRALILRELRLKYSDTRVGFVMEFFRPVIVVVFHYFLFVAIGRHMPARIPVELFVLGGFSVWFTFSHTMLATVYDRRRPAGIPGVTAMHARIATALWEFTTNISFCFAAVFLLKLLGWEEPLPDFLASAEVLGLAAAFGLAVGLFFEGLGRLVPMIERMTKTFRWAFYVTTGIYFSESEWHHGIANLVWYNPTLHLVEFQRAALYPGYPVARVTLLYPAAWSFGLLFVALMLNRCLRDLRRE